MINPNRNSGNHSAATTSTLALTVVCFGIGALLMVSAQPSWWAPQGALASPQVYTNSSGYVTTNYLANPSAVVNQGQLKQFTLAATKELNLELTNYGAGTGLTGLTNTWYQDYQANGYNAGNLKPGDYQAMNVGQLKQIASVLYGQLTTAGHPELYPSWIQVNSNTDNALANLGQLKQLFNFELYLTDDLNSEVDTRLSAAGTASLGTGPQQPPGNAYSYTGGNMSIFSSINDPGMTYVRNKAVWTGALDLTGISAFRSGPSSSTGTFGETLTLISPSDAVLANHTIEQNPYNSVGSTYSFVDNNNVVYTATIQSLYEGAPDTSQNYQHTGVGGTVGSTYTDIALAHLTWSPSIPTSLKFYKILPSTYQKYSPGHLLSQFPIIALDQQRVVYCGNTTSLSSGLFYYGPSSSSLRQPFSLQAAGAVRTGDSSCPIFCVVNGDLVLMGSLWVGGSTYGGCSSIADYTAAINSALATNLQSAYQLTPVDLSRTAQY